ncbi:Abi family protein [Streptococcus sp. zg-JUN1979]|uniref:Abi family protein n=1 Tax=Streptococcus sp. zg-JUN1979 TaxID=3391450 RepID=UPI0039A71E18
MKEYKTFNQQLSILRSRGMTVPTDGKPKRFLEQENYYNVINGYKDLFLKRDANNRPIVPEEFLTGTHFNELKQLFLFDRELRILFLKYLLIFENSIKTTIAHSFAKKYPRKNSYLDLSNFVDDNPKQVLNQISILTKTIHDKVGQNGSVKHYIEEHGEVPLWVLVNFLTIGNISHFYNILTQTLKNDIAKFYSNKYNKQLSPRTNIHLSPEDLSAALKATNLIRNVCAHDERLYNISLKNIRLRPLTDFYHLDNIDNKKLIVMIIYLKVFLDKTYFLRFYKELIKLLEKYKENFTSVKFEDILYSMGIDLPELEKIR